MPWLSSTASIEMLQSIFTCDFERNSLMNLHNPGAAILHEAWKAYRPDRPRYEGDALVHGRPVAEVWKQHGKGLRDAWELFVSQTLDSVAWAALRLLLERQTDLRWLWLRPGGYFYTKANNRRKVIREKLRPRVTVTVRDQITRAEALYRDATGDDGEALMVATLALSGAICDGSAFEGDEAPVRIRHTKPRPVGRPRRFWPWPRSVRSRLRTLCEGGLLSQPDERILR